jgi:hypothetical protein
MPSKFDKIAIGCQFLDKRIKVLDCQKQMIPIWHEKGQSIRAIARMLNVDKRLIQFIIYPERKAKNLQDRKAKGGSMQYYNKDKHNKAMKIHRQYKSQILKP